MTDLAARLRKLVEFKPCGSSNFGDVLRDEGVQWENTRLQPIIEALIEATQLVERLNITLQGHEEGRWTRECLAGLKALVKETE